MIESQVNRIPVKELKETEEVERKKRALFTAPLSPSIAVHLKFVFEF